jgi:hypothetical protein
MGSRVSLKLQADRVYGEYDGKLWDNDAKKIIYAKWDPNSPRTPLNFNPFETWDGNSPDASGFFPGETRYKDPLRGDVSFAIMMAERAEAEERAAVSTSENTLFLQVFCNHSTYHGSTILTASLLICSINPIENCTRI